MDASGGNAEGPKPVLELRLERVQQSPQTGHVRYFTVLMQELDFVAEKHFLDIVFQWYCHQAAKQYGLCNIRQDTKASEMK